MEYQGYKNYTLRLNRILTKYEVLWLLNRFVHIALHKLAILKKDNRLNIVFYPGV